MNPKVPPKVLLVEDNENNRYLTQFLLERAGFTVVVAVNGRQALEMVSREMPDLIVMDIQMPEMDGYETAVRLKSNTASSHIPIVGVSSFAMAGDREKAIQAGFAGYLEKPINPETFGREIRQFCTQCGEEL
jgi:two-component system cell cycle response regulator DivK